MRRLWNKLIGDQTRFSLEARVFHTVCLVVIVGLSLNIPFNYLMGMPALSLLMLGIVIGVSIIYYFSRVKHQYNSCIIIFQVLDLLVLVLDHYFNYGSHGPSYAVFLLSFLISVIVVPQKQFWIWLPLNILLMLGLLYYEAMHPNWMKSSYLHASDRFIDLGFTYLIVALTIFLSIAYIRNAFSSQHTQLLEKALALEESNETKNKLLSLLAHDLKEPLSSIQGFLELINGYQVSDSERIDLQKQLLARTKETSHLLTNILAWTKGQMNSMQVKVAPQCLVSVLSNTLTLLKSIALEKKIDLFYKFSESNCVYGDKDMLQLVIRNLVVNAIKFTHPGGTIRINAEVQDSSCIISVADTGSGISLRKQSNLFSLAAGTTFGTGHEKGAGLGLLLCKEFAELQGGKIRFKSEENVGSTFFLIMPLCESKIKD